MPVTNKVGILGGGTLAAQLAAYASQSGFKVTLMDNSFKPISATQKSMHSGGNTTKFEDVLSFGQQLDYIAVHTENANIAALKLLQNNGVKVHPAPETLELLQDKCLQKEVLIQKNIPVVTGWWVNGNTTILSFSSPSHSPDNNEPESKNAAGEVPTYTLHKREEFPHYPSFGSPAGIAKSNLHVLVHRNDVGVIECYYPALMILDQGKMLFDFDMCPASISTGTALNACLLAGKVAEAIDLIGTVAVDIIGNENGQLYVNDVALRPQTGYIADTRAQNPGKVATLTKLLLNLPAEDADQTAGWSKTLHTEPAAHRKFIISEALKTILPITDMNETKKDEFGRKRKNKVNTVNEETNDEHLSKAIVIRHLLQ